MAEIQVTGTKISQLEEKSTLTGEEYVVLQDGTANKKAKVSALSSLAGLPAFVLSSDLAGGNGVISSAVWERLMAARTANTPIVVINDNGSLPVANVAILGFGNNEQKQGTTDIIMPARVNDLSDYTVTQTVYQITGSGSTYNIATVTKNLKFYNSGDGTKFLANDGTYKEIGAVGVSVVDHGTADTTFTLTPNVLHKWGEVATLTLTLGTPTDGVVNEYMAQFVSGTTATILTLPDTVKWIGDNTIEADKTYQVSIINNLAVLGGA